MKTIHPNVMANDNARDTFTDDVDPPMSPMGRALFDMMIDMNRAFISEFKRDDKDRK